MRPPTSAWQPTPPHRKRNPWKTIGIATGGIVAHCCNGLFAIGIFTDPPAQNSNTAVTAADEAADRPLPRAADVSAPKGAPRRR
jgi:hypothetical protein